MPHPPNDCFTGREDVLTQLHTRFITNQASGSRQAITGLGGIGKTQTTVKYAYKHQNDYKAVLWLNAATRETVVAGFSELAHILELPAADLPEQAVVEAAVKRWLRDNSDWLLILDNADDIQLARSVLPDHLPGHILITARPGNLDELEILSPIELIELPLDDAVKFLFDRTGRNQSNSEEAAAAEELATELGCLPLALEQAGAYIKAMHASLQDYLKNYRNQPLTLLEKIGPKTGKYHSSVAKTWAMNFAEVEKYPASADLLRISAFLGPDRIPLEFFIAGVAELGPAIATALQDVEDNSLLLDEVLEPLTRYSLIRRDIENSTYDIHRLVQFVIRDGLPADARNAWAERAIMAITKALPETIFTKWHSWEQLLPHARVCVELSEVLNVATGDCGHLCSLMGGYTWQRAQYNDAIIFHSKALALYEIAYGNKHSYSAMSLNNLALAHKHKGNFAIAEGLYLRALHMHEELSGSDNYETAEYLNNLAVVYKSQGNYYKAERSYQRAIQIHEKSAQHDDQFIGTALNNLASLYLEQSKFSLAEPLYHKSQIHLQKVLGLDHPIIGQLIHNIAALRERMGDFEAAHNLYLQALTIREKTIGPDHPGTAQTLNNLAGCFQRELDYKTAEMHYKRAITIYEKNFEVGHPDATATMENYASLLRSMGRNSEATLITAQTMSRRKKHEERNKRA